MAFATIDMTKGITGTIPVANGGTGLASGTTGQFLKFTGSTTVASAAVQEGLSATSQWRLTTTFSSAALPITSNWEQVDTDGYANLGSAITESSGVFSFPATGFWLITFCASYNASSANDRYVNTLIETTTSTSSFDVAAKAFTNIPQSVNGTSTGANGVTSFLFDVTNVSTHKVRFGCEFTNSNTQMTGASTYNNSFITFSKLGDT